MCWFICLKLLISKCDCIVLLFTIPEFIAAHIYLIPTIFISKCPLYKVCFYFSNGHFHDNVFVSQDSTRYVKCLKLFTRITHSCAQYTCYSLNLVICTLKWSNASFVLLIHSHLTPQTDYWVSRVWLTCYADPRG